MVCGFEFEKPYVGPLPSSSHQCFGLRWSVSGEWMHHAMVTVAACSSMMVNLLCSFMDSYRVPLAVVAVLFELKVEATLRFGRWLWGLSQGVQCFLTTTFENWARQLLGAKPGITQLVVKRIWVGLVMRPTALLLILLQYGENFGLWKVPLLVVFPFKSCF